MKRLITLFLTLSLLLPSAVSAGGSTSFCWVEPAQVPLGSSFTVNAQGLAPSKTYWLNITQAKDPSNSGHPNWSLETDSTGFGTTTVPSTTWSPDGILTVGAVKVRAYPTGKGNKGTVNCAFEVIAGV